jgi:hypothetical protein
MADKKEEQKADFKATSTAFRSHLHDLTTPRFTTASKQNLYEYADFFTDNHAPPWLFELTQAWAKLYDEPFKGVTSDGILREELFKAQDEGIDIEKVVKSAEKLLGELSQEEKKNVSYKVGANEWRAWSNPEILLRPFGVRLEERTHSPLFTHPRYPS